MGDIPIEAQELAKAFLAQQAKEELERTEGRKGQSPKRLAREEGKLKSPLTTSEVERLAVSCGLRVEGGNGRHGKHIISPSGEECSLPDHGRGGELAKGTGRTILAFIARNGISSS